MKFPKAGKRTIKTVVSVFLSIFVYVLLLMLNNLLGIDKDDAYAPSMMYTPFYAAIAAVYATHRDRKSSFSQAKIRSYGSVVGGYYGMVLILLSEFILIDIFNLEEQNFILFKLITFLVVSIGIIPLISFTVMVKQNTAVFITCLTFFSVTISTRNGGMPVFWFATNRVLSTLVGIGISLLVNNFSFFRNKNKDILFVSSLDNNFLTNGNGISAFVKYKLNNLYFKNMPLTFATTRTLSSLEYVFEEVEVNQPMVVMNGASIYSFEEKKYDNIYNINHEARLFIEEKLKENAVNAFVYSINDNMLHCYHQKLINEGEKSFYNIRRKNDFDNFVRADLPCDLQASMFIIIDVKDKIEKIVESIDNSPYNNLVDLVVYKYDEIESDYWYLKINSHYARKENLIDQIREKGEFSKLIVCGSGRTDIPLIHKSYFSICLSTAPEYLQKEVDLVIDNNPESVVKVFEEIFHARNIDKKITKIKRKYMKNV